MKITQRLRIMLKSMLNFQMGEVATDKAVLVFDGEELKEGMEVYILNEEGEPEVAPDGDYTVEDGKVIKVVEGRVAEIVDPEAEVAEEPIAETTEKIAQEEVQQEDVAQEENPDVTPAEEPEPEEKPEEEDRIAALEARLEEFTAGLNQIINAIAGLEDRLTDVEGKLAKVEEPAADPVDENPDVEQNAHKNILNYLRKD